MNIEKYRRKHVKQHDILIQRRESAIISSQFNEVKKYRQVKLKSKLRPNHRGFEAQDKQE